nr:guanine nucleotide-binding protein-like nsn1 [Quercus suber]
MVKRSKKSKSKRVPLKKKHKIIRKVKEHHRKKAKEAKKLGLNRKNKLEKDPGIPNDWPFKEQELKALEARCAHAIDELELKKAERKEREAANMVVKKRNWKLRDQELRVSHARKDSTPSKRPNPSHAEAPTAPAKRLAMDPRTPKSNNRANTKAPLSYQGKRAHKSDLQKSDHPKSSRPGHLNSKNQ